MSDTQPLPAAGPHASPGRRAEADARLADMPYDFTPVPLMRVRANGWSPLTQKRFIVALDAMGSVGAAARAVGMSRKSAYALRERPGAESFAAAWDVAIGIGKDRAWDAAITRALDGVTTITIRKGGSVSITGGMDFRMVNAALPKGGALG